MSRSNPTESTPNPAVRRYEWNGEAGTIRYYDREVKRNIDVGTDFTFLLLDEMASVGGWDDSAGTSGSAIYSNEVRDTRTDVFVVKSFKGGIIAEGLYAKIKNAVTVQGGQFVAKCYIAFKEEGGALAIGTLSFKGAALAAWMEFRKQNRAELYKNAVRIHAFTEGKKGKVVYRVPMMKVAPITPATDASAVACDKHLQEWLAAYLSRTKKDQVEHVGATEVHDHRQPGEDDGPEMDDPRDQHDDPPPAPMAAPARPQPAMPSPSHARRNTITDEDTPF